MNPSAVSIPLTPLGGFLPPWVLPVCHFGLPVRKLGVVTVFAPDPDPLVVRCQQGDKTAFSELFHRHRADVARIVQRMLGPVPEVEDVIQDIFIQVFRSLRDFEGKSKFSTWLHRVSVNIVLMHRRAQRSRPHLVEESERHVPTDHLGPDEDAMRRERIRAFYAVLERLPEKKRTVFILHEIEGLHPKEIAQIVEAPALTVRTRLFYARRDILQLLREEPSLAPLANIMLRPGSSDHASAPEEEP